MIAEIPSSRGQQVIAWKGGGVIFPYTSSFDIVRFLKKFFDHTDEKKKTVLKM